ncbi:MAG: transcriptional regulator [Sphingobacteriaceae bacterium]|nr:MAG: transcriptional regulator [Sphingobacteriaceae bacterium]
MENKSEHAECPATEVLALIGGRWKLTILHVLCKHTRRFGEINVRVPSISRKVLTEQLRELGRFNDVAFHIAEIIVA